MSGADAAISSAIVERGVERVVGDALHDAQRHRLVGVDGAPREQEVARRALTDEHREPPDVRGAEVHAELAAGNRELRAGHGDAQVARDRELHARAHRRRR